MAKNLVKMETECKASWEYLKAVAKHDGIPINKSRYSHSSFINQIPSDGVTLAPVGNFGSCG